MPEFLLFLKVTFRAEKQDFSKNNLPQLKQGQKAKNSQCVLYISHQLEITICNIIQK